MQEDRGKKAGLRFRYAGGARQLAGSDQVVNFRAELRWNDRRLPHDADVVEGQRQRGDRERDQHDHVGNAQRPA